MALCRAAKRALFLRTPRGWGLVEKILDSVKHHKWKLCNSTAVSRSALGKMSQARRDRDRERVSDRERERQTERAWPEERERAIE